MFASTSEIAVAALLAGALAPALAAAAGPGGSRVILVGDSTMAPRTGYGDALCRLLAPPAECINLARGGRSSKSYRADGSWERVVELLGDRDANRATYVLIQFGHNDQPGKAERTTDLETEFPADVAGYAEEVRSAGASAVLMTPLARRSFRDGILVEDLAPWAEATRRVARAKGLPLLDLNAESAAVVARMGATEADALAMAGKDFDRTHLGPKGAQLFADMVARELAEAVPAFAASAARPQLTAAQARAYAYAEVLGPWDPLSDPLASGAAVSPDYVVDASGAADGKATFATIQSAVSAAVSRASAARRGERVRILVKPGTYRGLVYVPESAAPITIYGASGDASEVRIVANLDAAMPGARYGELFARQFDGADAASAAMFASVKERATIATPGSAVAWIRNTGFQAKNLTFANAYNKDRGDAVQRGSVHSQAVAMLVDDADRVQFENVRFEGFQDTLYLKSSAPERPARTFVHKSHVEGDMDFIFGEGTAFFLESEIRSLGDRTEHYVLAPSTHYRSRFGFVFSRCAFTHDGTPNALAGSYKLARQWFRGARCTPFAPPVATPGYACTLGASDEYEAPKGTISRAPLEAVGKVAILESRIGAHIDRVRPWVDWNARGTLRYRPAQFGSDDYWDHLVAAGIDPVRDLGYIGRKAPAEPFIAEFRNASGR